MSKLLLLTTKKEDGQTKANVRTAAASAYPSYRVASVVDKGEEWEVRIEELATDKVSSRSRQAAPPPDFLKDKEDSSDEEGSPEEEASESPEEEAEEDSGEDKDEGKSEDDKDKPKGEDSKGKEKDPVKAIETIMGELNKLLTDLGGHAQTLKDKADKVDEVHELTKGPDTNVDDMGEVPPVPPIDEAADLGPTPGAGVVPPHRPPVPTGKAPGRPVGVPTFTKKKTKIVEHPIKDDDGEYSLADFLAAIATDPQCEGYVVAEVKTLKEANVYAGKLELAE